MEGRGLADCMRGPFAWRFEEGGAVLESWSGAEARVRVPDLIDGLPVVAVGPRAFLGASGLEAVELPETVLRIGESAFYGCARLRWAMLPLHMESIGPRAFQGCAALRTIRLPKGLCEIAPRAFYVCSRLVEIDIPEGVTRIGESAFSGCARLTRAVLPEGLEELGEAAFFGCAALKKLDIPMSVTRLSVTSVPPRLSTDGQLYLPRQGLLVRAVASLRYAAPGGTRIIADGAMMGNHDLTEVLLPKGLASIGGHAFEDCRCLHDINLPESVESLGEAAFRGCVKLAAVSLPGGLRMIPDRLFESGGLKSVALPEGVASVGASAFAGCASLEEVRLNDALELIGDYAFARCAALRSLALPRGLLRVGKGALTGCAALSELTLPGPPPEGLEAALGAPRRLAIVAPKAGPEAFPPLWRRQACLGFALMEDRGEPVEPAIRNAYVRWIQSHAAMLAAHAAESPALLRAMIRCRALAPGDAHRLIDRFSREDKPELTAEVLGYVHTIEEDDEELW